MAMWTAHCTDTGDWAIFIAPTADVQVRQCRHSKELGLPECKEPEASGKPRASGSQSSAASVKR
jgi:hypothetical protein